MKYLKNHLFLILALVSILFSIEVYFISNKIISAYEQKISKNYTIIVVSKIPLKNINSPLISYITPIDVTNSLEKIKSQFHNFDINKIKNSLPYFYQLHLKKFPNPKELEYLTNALKLNPNIKRIETFKIAQTQTYNLLVIVRMVTTIFMILISIISFLLIVKQLEVSKFEHSQRIYIMELFGAPFWFKSAILLKLAIIDSFLSIGIIFVILEYLFNSSAYISLLHQLGISININIFTDMGIFAIISFVISLIATFIVILSKKEMP